jgi:hypothetical protein
MTFQTIWTRLRPTAKTETKSLSQMQNANKAKHPSMIVDATPSRIGLLSITEVYSQEPFSITGLPLGNVIRSIDTTPTTASVVTESGYAAPNGAASLNAQGFPSLQLALQPERFLSLLAELSFGTASQQLCVRVVMLELLDVVKQSFNLVTSPVDIVIQLGVHLVPPLNLRLEVLDSAVNVAKRALLRAVLALLIF